MPSRTAWYVRSTSPYYGGGDDDDNDDDGRGGRVALAEVGAGLWVGTSEGSASKLAHDFQIWKISKMLIGQPQLCSYSPSSRSFCTNQLSPLVVVVAVEEGDIVRHTPFSLLSFHHPMSSSGPSRTIIIITAAIGGAIVLFVVIRILICIHRRRKLEPVPLPPARPLVYEGPYSSSRNDLSTTSLRGGYHSSDPSMTQRSTPLGGSLAGHYSLSTENMPLREPPSPATTSSTQYGNKSSKNLQPPQIPFSAYPGNGSSAQISTVSGGSERSTHHPYRYLNTSGISVNTEQEESGQIGPSPVSSSPPSPHPSVQSRGRARPISMAPSVSSMRSTSRTVRSARSMTTIRGPPHSPHSHVEIVLPAPLATQPGAAPGAYYEEARDALTSLREATRPTFSDPWLTVGRENVNMSRSPSRERLRRSGSSRPEGSQPCKSLYSVRTCMSTLLTPSFLSVNSVKRSRSKGSISRSISEQAPPKASSGLPPSLPTKSQPQPVSRKPSLDQITPPVPRLPSLHFGTLNSAMSIPSLKPEPIPARVSIPIPTPARAPISIPVPPPLVIPAPKSRPQSQASSRKSSIDQSTPPVPQLPSLHFGSLNSAMSIPSLRSEPKSIPAQARAPPSVPVPPPPVISASNSKSSARAAVRSIIELISDKEKMKPPSNLEFSYRESLQRHSLQRDSVQLAISKMPETKPGPCFVDDMLTTTTTKPKGGKLRK